MAWRFRKSKNIGPFRASISSKGVGKSIGLFGFHIGVTADGRKYWSFGLKGSGLYYIRYY
jgi:hypothetical protein